MARAWRARAVAGYLNHSNPFVGAAEATGDGPFGQPRLPAEAVNEQRELACSRALEEIAAVDRGEKDPAAVPMGVWAAAFSRMCNDILMERKRIGGDWVVAQSV